MAAVAAMAWITRPVAIGILLGALNAFTMQPFYERMRARGRRPAAAAGIALGLSSIMIVAVLAAVSSLLVGRGVVLAHALIAALSPGAPAHERVVAWTRHLEPIGLRADDLPARLRDAAAELAASAASIAAFVASASFGALLGLFFLLMTTYFVLRHWTSIARRAEDVLPLHPRHTRVLLEQLRIVGRTTLLGTVLTGIAQGLLAAIGYLITGTPEAAFLGVATAVASLIPAVGTLLVWLPVGVYLILTHHVGMGILELIWGALVVVGVSDYVIRPRLVGRDGTMPALFTFAALLGGVEAFGLIGLLVGPLVMALAVSTIRTYAAEMAGRHAAGKDRRTASRSRPALAPGPRWVLRGVAGVQCVALLRRRGRVSDRANHRRRVIIDSVKRAAGPPRARPRGARATAARILQPAPSHPRARAIARTNSRGSSQVSPRSGPWGRPLWSSPRVRSSLRGLPLAAPQRIEPRDAPPPRGLAHRRLRRSPANRLEFARRVRRAARRILRLPLRRE